MKKATSSQRRHNPMIHRSLTLFSARRGIASSNGPPYLMALNMNIRSSGSFLYRCHHKYGSIGGRTTTRVSAVSSISPPLKLLVVDVGLNINDCETCSKSVRHLGQLSDEWKSTLPCGRGTDRLIPQLLMTLIRPCYCAREPSVRAASSIRNADDSTYRKYIVATDWLLRRGSAATKRWWRRYGRHTL